MVIGGVKVCHERGDVLGCCQPGVDIVTRVKKPASGNGDILHLVSVEGKFEAEVDGGGPSVALGQHAVFLDFSSVLTGLVSVVKIDKVTSSIFFKI